MPDTTTTNYGFVLPEVGGSDDTWGTKNNQNWVDVDADIKAVDTTLRALITSSINSAIASAVPSGMIAMWAGTIASIPAAWKLCDGTLGAPDLRDKFVVGASAGANAGATGGSNTVTQVLDHNHGHTFSVNSDGIHNHGIYDPGHNHGINDPGHTHTAPAGRTAGSHGSQRIHKTDNVDGTFTALSSQSTGISVVGNGTGINDTQWAGTHTHSLSGGISSVGVAAPDNRPAFYSVLFIQKR